MMESRIEALELEIKVLKERIEILERKERRRKIMGMIKGMISLSIFILFVIFIYHFYQEMVDLYDSFLIKF